MACKTQRLTEFTTKWCGGRRVERSSEGNDRLIYSNGEEWVNQTLMAFGSESHLSSTTISHSLTPSFRSANPPSTPHASFLFLSGECTLGWALGGLDLPALTDGSPPMSVGRVNQGALHAQRDKVNDKKTEKIKRERGGDFLWHMAAANVIQALFCRALPPPPLMPPYASSGLDWKGCLSKSLFPAVVLSHFTHRGTLARGF